MKFRWRAILAAFTTAAVVNLVGVLFFFEPIAKADDPNGPLAHPLVGFLAYVVLSVVLFDWTARQMRNAYKAAFVVAAAQFVLVNVDFVLAGKRGLMTGMASTALMAATWICVAIAYSMCVDWSEKPSGSLTDSK